MSNDALTSWSSTTERAGRHRPRRQRDRRGV